MKKAAVCALAVVSLTEAVRPNDEGTRVMFQEFMDKYDRKYETEYERQFRFLQFSSSLDEIERLEKLNPLATFGYNHLSDRTPDELSALRGYVKPVTTPKPDNVSQPKVEAMANEVDWRTKGVVSAVKNQEQCGSCWAFSATEEIESSWAMKGNRVPDLSPQQITSCDTQDGGCNGGNTETAYQYVKQAGGIDTASSYPYTSGNGNTGRCKVKKSGFYPGIKVSGYNSVGRDNENALASAMNTDGPISVCLDASSWSYYTGGVMTSCGKQVDHCVQAVGYNKNAATPYWIVRNSWGTGWGINGYIHLEMGKDLCAITNDPTTVNFE